MSRRNRCCSFQKSTSWETNPLSVADIVGLKLDQARLAYLSSCHATNYKSSLLDEPVHMTIACQLAGFPTVIGTMWQVDDEKCVKVSEYFYRVLLTEDGFLDFQKVAQAIHFAANELRNEDKDDVMLWAPLFHVGV